MLERVEKPVNPSSRCRVLSAGHASPRTPLPSSCATVCSISFILDATICFIPLIKCFPLAHKAINDYAGRSPASGILLASLLSSTSSLFFEFPSRFVSLLDSGPSPASASLPNSSMTMINGTSSSGISSRSSSGFGSGPGTGSSDSQSNLSGKIANAFFKISA